MSYVKKHIMPEKPYLVSSDLCRIEYCSKRESCNLIQIKGDRVKCINYTKR